MKLATVLACRNGRLSLRRFITGLSTIAISHLVIAQAMPVVQWIQCEDYSASQGVEMVPYTPGEPRLGVKNCSDGDWIRFDSINFMAGEFDSLYFWCWTEWETTINGSWDRDRYTQGDRVVVRLDSPTGPVLATIPLGTTMCFGYGASDQFGVSIGDASGIRDLYLVFEGTGAICEADKFCLTGSATYDASEARTYYVATDGDDGHDGLSLGAPFRTIQRAAAVMKPGSRCLIRQGIYREVVKPLHTGLSGAPLSFEAYNSERVVICGADPVTGWTPHSGNIYKAQVDWSLPKYRNQLLVNGETTIVARSPNIDDPYDPPPGYENMSPYGIRNMTRWHDEVHPLLIPSKVQMWMQYDDEAARSQGFFEIQIQQWASENWLPGYLLNHSADYYKGGLLSLQNLWWVNVGEISASRNLSGDMAGVRLSAWTINDGGNCCNGGGFISYLLPLLDQPNEWYLDENTGTVYLWGPDGGDPSAHLVEAKRRVVSVDLTGKQYVTLKGLWFLSTAVTLEGAWYCTIDDCHFKYPSYFDAYKWYEEFGGSHWFGTPYDASDGKSGVFIGGGHNVVKNSSSQVSSASGFTLGGRYQTVENCIIHDVCLLPTYDAGIRAWKRDFYDDSPDGAGMLIKNNTIYNCGRSTIEIDYDGDGRIPEERSRICYNDLSRCGLNSYEVTSVGLHGGVYRLEIDHNRFHSTAGVGIGYLGSDPSWGCYGINVHHNVFYKGNPIFDWPDNGAVNSHWVVGEGDSALRVINNTCVDSTQIGARDWDLYPMETFPAKCFANNIYGMSDTVTWRYSDPDNHDYTPRANSPAVNAGIVVPGYTDNVTDGQPDLGAHEYGQTPWRAGADWEEKEWVYPPGDITAGARLGALRAATGALPGVRIAAGRIILSGHEGVAYTARIINPLGRTVVSITKPRGGKSAVSTDRLSAGMYVIRVTAANRVLAVKALLSGSHVR